MACPICDHCQNPIDKQEAVVVREGYSYHVKCHKCFICSNTNLKDARNFMGALFCQNCSHRIFENNVPEQKPLKPNQKHQRIPKHKKRNVKRVRTDPGEDIKNRDSVERARGVITMASVADSRSKHRHRANIADKPSEEYELDNENKHDVESTENDSKISSAEIGITTTVTGEMLRRHVKTPNISENELKAVNHPYSKDKDMGDNRTLAKKSTSGSSDIRIAEIGESTEIATMALRRKSDCHILHRKSRARPKDITSLTLSILNQNIDSSDTSKKWVQSYVSALSEPMHWLDMGLGSLLKLPYIYFKRHILEESSLINEERKSKTPKKLFKKFNQLLSDEITEHQGRGVKKLYPTINRMKRPYKLGWLRPASPTRRCEHFRKSHSYRCMRHKVMRLAGPTPSRLAVIRKLVAKRIFHYDWQLYVLIDGNSSYHSWW